MKEYLLEWPNYKPYPYEQDLAMSELCALTGGTAEVHDRVVLLRTPRPVDSAIIERVAFASRLHVDGKVHETHIARLERSGLTARYGPSGSSRKESNYLTHGLHRYKGKFYPQLARALLNISGAKRGDLILDPFMGSGTTLLESWLMGVDSIGFDINPLAHLITRTKVSALKTDPAILRDAVNRYELSIRNSARGLGLEWNGVGSRESCGQCRATPRDLARAVGRPSAEREFQGWFPPPVLEKLLILVLALNSVSNPVGADFIRVCISDILRDVSQQEPRDLRIRRRTQPIDDAPVLTNLFVKLHLELSKIEAGRDLLQQSQLVESWAIHADVRRVLRKSYELLQKRQVDAVISSPPYATALPYVDTDRLSYMVLGLTSKGERNLLQRELIGTREILDGHRRKLEHEMMAEGGLDSLPAETAADLRHMLSINSNHRVGFRRRNTPALLYQYFRDMKLAIKRVAELCRPSASVFLVLGDSKTTLGDGEVFSIRTCDHVTAVCEQVEFEIEGRVPITVTREDVAHAKNAITRNQILILRRR